MSSDHARCKLSGRQKMMDLHDNCLKLALLLDEL